MADWAHLCDPDSGSVVEALSRRCELCKAPRGELCVNIIRPGVPLPGRLVHLARL